MIETIWQDVRYALRMLAKSPAFTLVALLSLAIGIGANTAIFSVANAVLFRPLRIDDAERVVSVYSRPESGRGGMFSVSYPDYQIFRDRNEVFDGLLCWGDLPLNLSRGEEDAEQAYGVMVSGNYFDVLGVRPARGRFFTPEEDRAPGLHAVAVISHGMWQRRFGGDTNVVGESVKLNGKSFTVVGVAPEGFTSTLPVYAPDVWVPLMMQKEVLPTGDMLAHRNAEWLYMTGRLREGVSMEQAKANISLLATQIEDAHPEQFVARVGDAPPPPRGLGVEILPVGSLPALDRAMVFGIFGMVLAGVGLVLLIACANLTSLLLARAAARRKEIAVRLAMGASRRRIIRQLLTESVLLCLLSGVAGLLLALWMKDLLLAFKPSIPLPVDLDMPVDVRVLGWTFALSLLTGLVFGLVPALQASRQDLNESLKQDARGRMGRRSARTLRELFVASQVAMSLLLLITAGLFLRAFLYASTLYPGAEPEQVQTASFDPSMLGYDDARTREFYRRLLERTSGLPGVEAASLAVSVPVGQNQMSTGIGVEGHDSFDLIRSQNEHSADMLRANFNVVSAGYFRTMKIPIVRGRDFRDALSMAGGAPSEAIIDERMARRFFDGQDPLGKRFTNGSTVFEIVGVAESARQPELDGEPHPFFYLPYGRTGDDAFFASRMVLHVRSSLPAQDVYAALRRELSALDRNMSLQQAMPLTGQIELMLLPQRVAAMMAGIFGFTGLVLASIGLFGVVSYSVAQRTHEIGVRMALGAQAGDVLSMVLRQGLRIAALGIILGLAGAFLSMRLLTSLLYGISATDPVTFAGVSLLLAAVALAASYVPARRATRVDPVVALRYE